MKARGHTIRDCVECKLVAGENLRQGKCMKARTVANAGITLSIYLGLAITSASGAPPRPAISSMDAGRGGAAGKSDGWRRKPETKRAIVFQMVSENPPMFMTLLGSHGAWEEPDRPRSAGRGTRRRGARRMIATRFMCVLPHMRPARLAASISSGEGESEGCALFFFRDTGPPFLRGLVAELLLRELVLVRLAQQTARASALGSLPFVVRHDHLSV